MVAVVPLGNEDDYLIFVERRIFMIADGMGGPGREVASDDPAGDAVLV